MESTVNIQIHPGQTEVTPAEAGFRPKRIDCLDAHFIELIRQQKLQCAGYLLARNGRVFAHKSMGNLCGFQNRGDLMPDSIRRIASITKMFTAVAVMKLVEDGKIHLEQPVSSILDEFNTAMHNRITIFHLLTHTSGICPDPGYFQEAYQRQWWMNRDENWIKAILSGPLCSEPGETWNYSSSCFGILGEIISRSSGMTYENYILKNIVEPMEMDSTFFDVPESLLNRVCMVEHLEEERLKSQDGEKNSSLSAGGGLYSTLYDLYKLGQMLLDLGLYKDIHILSRKSVEAMIRPQVSGIPAFHWGEKFNNYKYGLGINIYISELLTPGTYNHEGRGRCALYIDPVEKLVAVYFVPSAVKWEPISIICTRGIIWSGLV
jgi:CubicO group peptidase (beta-lactamase class C family)